MRRLSKLGVVVVMSILLIIVSILGCCIGVSSINKINKEKQILEQQVANLNGEIVILNEQISVLTNQIAEINKKEEHVESEPEILAKKYKITSDNGVNVRESNNTEAKILKMMDYNDIFEGVEIKNEDGSIWVNTDNGFICIKTSSGYSLAKEIDG